MNYNDDNRTVLTLNSGEVWLFRDFYDSNRNIEESVSIRAVQSEYLKNTNIKNENFTPKDIYEIVMRKQSGDKEAALDAFRKLGIALGEAIATVATLIDGIIVIGGGVAGASELILPSALSVMNGNYEFNGEKKLHRLATENYNLEESQDMKNFLKGDSQSIIIPETDEEIMYDNKKRIGVAISKIGTSEAVSTGAYAFALHQIDRNK